MSCKRIDTDMNVHHVLRDVVRDVVRDVDGARIIKKPHVTAPTLIETNASNYESTSKVIDVAAKKIQVVGEKPKYVRSNSESNVYSSDSDSDDDLDDDLDEEESESDY